MTATERGRGLALLLAAAAVCGLLAGCCSLGIKSCPATDQFTFVGDKSLNSCSGDEYSFPVAVRVYYLSQPGPFEAAEFQELWENEDAALGATRLGPALNVTVTPGGETEEVAKRPDGAAYLGIVANFCRLDGGAWRKVVPLGKDTRAVVRLKDVHLAAN
ncbi:MAG: type VI secretion system lipoprotein TssJ [Krumholzibacteria bacterium]|nr:type VI secretion system lipoprotein TssJ [Candidatus Krumholzibacteria bacterium]